jgi:hypothetical protein
LALVILVPKLQLGNALNLNPGEAGEAELRGSAFRSRSFGTRVKQSFGTRGDD